MEAAISEMIPAAEQAAGRTYTGNPFAGAACCHINEYWTGREQEIDYLAFSVHYFEYYCPDCSRFYWLTWKPAQLMKQ